MIVYLAGNLSPLFFGVHKFTCIRQFWREQDRELPVLSPTTPFPGARNMCLVHLFRHLSVPVTEPQHQGNEEIPVGTSNRLLQALEIPK